MYATADHTLSETCLATHSGNDCIALTLASIEAEMLKQQAQQQQQAASSRNSSADDTTTTVRSLRQPRKRVGNGPIRVRYLPAVCTWLQ